MADSENHIDNPTETQTPYNAYQEALFAAWNELSAVREEEKSLMTLANAIRLMVQSCNERAITVKELRGKLQDIGYDLSKYKNPLASIHTAANRMVESNELAWFDDDGNKLTSGPEMKPVLMAEPDATAMAGMLGENTAGEK